MKNYRVFDIIGPRMIGPSSSHTAGAAKLGYVARRIAGVPLKSAHVTLYESFATTGKGHGTDRAIAGGLLGFEQDDERLCNSIEIAKERGVEVSFTSSEEEARHPNSARIVVIGEDGSQTEILGASVGGGNIEIMEINGMEVSFSCNYPTIVALYSDKPGVIQMVTTILARNNINIAYMRAFRSYKRHDACMVLETDEVVRDEIIKAIVACVPEIWRMNVI